METLQGVMRHHMELQKGYIQLLITSYIVSKLYLITVLDAIKALEVVQKEGRPPRSYPGYYSLFNAH